VFHEFDYDPIASASIAQVHRAKLADSVRTEVAVKVMHRGVDRLFRQDIRRGIKIAKVAAWLNSDFELLVTVWESWEKDIEQELNFEHEAGNLKSVRSSMIGLHESNVIVPEVIDRLVSKTCFAMGFVDNCFKLDDLTALSLYGVDQTALLEVIVHAWCCQLFQNNLANADPHPGNVLVRLSGSDKGAQPVLLDWGWTVSLEQQELEGLRRFVIAMSDMDMTAAAAALKLMGYVNNQDERSPERSVAFFAYLFRPTGSVESMTRSREEFFKQRKTETDADKKNGVREKGGRKMTKVPKCFMTVVRIFGLLRGLCTTHQVEIPLLEVMASHARLGLLRDNIDENLPSGSSEHSNR